MIVHQLVFNIALYSSYVLYIIAYLQIGTYNPKYLDTLQEFMKYYVTIFLLVRFNPLVKSQFNEFDRKVVFSSAVFLLATTIFNQYAKSVDLTELLKVLRFVR